MCWAPVADAARVQPGATVVLVGDGAVGLMGVLTAKQMVAAQIKHLTQRIGADSVLECIGTKESVAQAIQCARPGSMIRYVGVPHGVELNGQSMFPRRPA